MQCYIYEIVYLRGRLLDHDGELEEALEIYTKSLAYKPSHYDLRSAIGRTQRLLGNHSESIQMFRDLLKAKPTEGRRNYELAKSYYADGNRKKALKHLETALDVWKNADSIFKPAIEAREKWADWNQIN